MEMIDEALGKAGRKPATGLPRSSNTLKRPGFALQLPCRIVGVGDPGAYERRVGHPARCAPRMRRSVAIAGCGRLGGCARDVRANAGLAEHGRRPWSALAQR